MIDSQQETRAQGTEDFIQSADCAEFGAVIRPAGGAVN
jgi:hypothetical protein